MMKNSIQLGIFSDKTPITMRRCSLELPKLVKNLKIAVLSDLHVGPYVKNSFIYKAIDMALAENCDFAVVPGDLASSFGHDSIERCRHCIEKLSSHIKTFCCIGNHGIRSGKQRLAAAIKQTSAKMLINSHTLEEFNGQKILLAGMDDVLRGAPDAKAALAEVPPAELTIMLCHNPDGADLLENVAGKIDLMISGHTHGGQVRLFGRPVMWGTKNHNYDIGLANGPHCPVFISSGLGVTRWPIRMGCKPEIAVLTLVPGA